LDGFNDMTGFVTGAPFHLAEDELKDYIDIEARLQQPLWPFTLSLIRYLHLRWHTTAHPHRTYAAGIDTTRWAQYKTISPLLDKGSRTFMEVAAHFVRTVRADSAQCIVVLQPMLGRKLNKPLTLKEQLLLADVHAQQSNPEIIEKFRKTHHLEDYGKLLGDDINQLSNTIHYYHYDSFISPGLQEAVEQCNGKFIDMNRVLAARQTNEDIYVDYCHLTPAGNRMVAEQIAELIE
jgi:hypothetical protein